MFRTLQTVLAGLVVLGLGLSWLARRYSDIAWLRVFRDQRPQLPELLRARMRQPANIHAGVEMILMGIILPIGSVALTVMMFNEFTTTGIVLVAGASVLVMGLGITAIWRNRGP